jgi:hypothetical protein
MFGLVSESNSGRAPIIPIYRSCKILTFIQLEELWFEFRRDHHLENPEFFKPSHDLKLKMYITTYLILNYNLETYSAKKPRSAS